MAAHRRWGDAATEPLLQYMVGVCPEDPDPAVRRWMSDKLGDEEVPMVKSWGQRLRDEGREEGRQEGLEEGARREREALVLSLLQRRSSPLPPNIQTRIAQASSDDLARVVNDIFQATALDELLPG